MDTPQDQLKDAPGPTHKSPVALVQEAFIREVSEKGITHVLTWIGQWYGNLADATVDEMLVAQLGEFKDDREGICLACESELASMAATVSNRSTSTGHELLKDAQVSALAKRFRHFGSRERNARWDALRQRLSPSAP